MEKRRKRKLGSNFRKNFGSSVNFGELLFTKKTMDLGSVAASHQARKPQPRSVKSMLALNMRLQRRMFVRPGDGNAHKGKEKVKTMRGGGREIAKRQLQKKKSAY